jgi:hypothetical protein
VSVLFLPRAILVYDHLNRIRKFCQPGSGCQLFSYVGDSDWVSVVKDDAGVVMQRYLYANGRPLRFDNLGHYQQPSYYYRYNARGDAAGFAQHNGDGGSGWRVFGAWGDLNYTSEYKGYYNWNAAWGYMAFPKEFNFDAHDALDIGLYYAHGRWYNQDTGLWLSPNEKGDYLYGGHGQDPVNVGWSAQQASLPPLPKEKKGRYIRTGYGAIIDSDHFDLERPKTIIRQLENHQSPIPINGNLILGHALLDARYAIDYPAVDVYGNALAIYMDFQRRYETAQDKTIGFLPNAKLSSFALEDLQPDYLGFYSVASGVGLAEIVNGSLGGGVWTDEDIHGCTLWILACQTPQNFESTPKVQVIERRVLLAVETPGFPNIPIVRIDWPIASWVNKPWPPELAEINGKPLIPITQGWRLHSCEITEGDGGPHLADCP